jgi:hypothetical protein
MTTLNAFVDQCWSDHAADPGGVAERMLQALPLVRDDDDLVRLSMLAHHVFGEHLGQWEEGIRFLERVTALGIQGDAGRSTLQRCKASLQLCLGAGDERRQMTASEACRVTVMAACNLSRHDTAGAAPYLEQAVIAAAGLSDQDPAVRALASFANNMAGTLQDIEERDDDGRSLMLRAAEVARSHWERAGTWREVERAEYRLAVCCLAAGDAGRALLHATLCDEIVRANGSEPLEVFFAAEALALAANLCANRGLMAEGLRRAESSFQEVDPADQEWCLPTLEKLRACSRDDLAGPNSIGADPPPR